MTMKIRIPFNWRANTPRSKLLNRKSWIRVKVAIHLFLGSCLSINLSLANYEKTMRFESSYFVVIIIDHMEEFLRLRAGGGFPFPAD